MTERIGRPAAVEVNVREMPHVRQIAEFMCENSANKNELQSKLWQIDAMATADVQNMYLAMKSEQQAATP